MRSAFEPVPVLEVPVLRSRGDRRRDARARSARSSSAARATTSPDAILHDTITQSIESDEHGATLRLAIPFANKEEIGLKQVGLELIVTAANQRRTIMLPPTLAAYKPVSATYVDGTLEVTFQS